MLCKERIPHLRFWKIVNLIEVQKYDACVYFKNQMKVRNHIAFFFWRTIISNLSFWVLHWFLLLHFANVYLNFWQTNQLITLIHFFFICRRQKLRVGIIFCGKCIPNELCIYIKLEEKFLVVVYPKE